MWDHYAEIKNRIKPRPTTISGLKFFPDIEPDFSNDQDHPPYGWISEQEVTDCNLQVVRDVVTGMGDRLHAIFEIGVNRNGERSMSRILMDDKPRLCNYLGCDLNDKSYLDDADKLIHTIMCSSSEHEKVRDKLRSMGVGLLDILFIDGWHSVNQCVNDWRYAEMLSDHGAIILHDTNSHPGPIALFEAIDENQYDKQRYCIGQDYGIAVVRKR